MTKEQQRIAIAEWMGTLGGWYCPKCRQSVSENELQSRGEIMFHLYCDIPIHRDSPNYPEDLNAMHEAEMHLFRLHEGKIGQYNSELSKLSAFRPLSLTVKEPRFIFDLLSAASTLRSEALCRTLWPERF
jgi:hypothetical protein